MYVKCKKSSDAGRRESKLMPTRKALMGDWKGKAGVIFLLSHLPGC